MNLNTAEPQKTFEVIPDGTFVKILLQIKAGGFNLPGAEAMDAGLFKTSKSSDAVMLECEMTVLEGPYAHRKFTDHWTVAGGSLDEKGNSKGFNITKTRMRAAIESNQNIRPDDMGAQAVATRQINGFKELDGITFFAKIKVDPGEPYVDQATGQEKQGFDRNSLDRIVTPDMVEYADLAAGKPVEAKPRGAARIGKSPGAATPAAGRSWGSPPAAQPGLPLGQTGQSAAAAATPAPAANKPAWLK